MRKRKPAQSRVLGRRRTGAYPRVWVNKVHYGVDVYVQEVEFGTPMRTPLSRAAMKKLLPLLRRAVGEGKGRDSRAK